MPSRELEFDLEKVRDEKRFEAVKRLLQIDARDMAERMTENIKNETLRMMAQILIERSIPLCPDAPL